MKTPCMCLSVRVGGKCVQASSSFSEHSLYRRARGGEAGKDVAGGGGVNRQRQAGLQHYEQIEWQMRPFARPVYSP